MPLEPRRTRFSAADPLLVYRKPVKCWEDENSFPSSFNRGSAFQLFSLVCSVNPVRSRCVAGPARLAT